MSIITKEEVLNLAQMSQIAIDEYEIDKVTKDVAAVLTCVSSLKDVELESMLKNLIFIKRKYDARR